MANPLKEKRKALVKKFIPQEGSDGGGGVIAHTILEAPGSHLVVPQTDEGRAALMKELRILGADPSYPAITPEVVQPTIERLIMGNAIGQIEQAENALGIPSELEGLPRVKRIQTTARRVQSLQAASPQFPEPPRVGARFILSRIFTLKPPGW